MLRPARGSSVAIPSNHLERSRASSQTSAGSSASQDSEPTFILTLRTSQSSLASDGCGNWYPTTLNSSSEPSSDLRNKENLRSRGPLSLFSFLLFGNPPCTIVPLRTSKTLDTLEYLMTKYSL